MIASLILAAAFVGTEPRPPIWHFFGRQERAGTFRDHGYIYPASIASVTYVADVTLDALPADGGRAAVCGRTGWHNALVVLPDGRLDFGCFSYDGKKGFNVKSKTKLVPGRQYRLAAVVDCSHGNETRLALYVDGIKEAEGVAFEGAPWRYPWRVWAGQLGEENGKPRWPLPGTVRNFWYFHQPLSSDEIMSLPDRPSGRNANRQTVKVFHETT